MNDKARFRALREMVGMTQAALADELGVEVRSVKRWESPTAAQHAPKAAWQIVEAAAERQRQVVDFALEKADEWPDGAVSLRYWSSQAEYDRERGDGGDWRMANANCRAIAAVLMAEGRDIEWRGAALV